MSQSPDSRVGASSNVSQPPRSVKPVILQAEIVVLPKTVSRQEQDHFLFVADKFKDKSSSSPIMGFTSEGEIFEVVSSKGLVNNPVVTQYIFSRFFQGIYQDILGKIPNFLNYINQSEDRRKIYSQLQEDFTVGAFYLLEKNQLNLLRYRDIFGFYAEGKPLAFVDMNGNFYRPRQNIEK